MTRLPCRTSSPETSIWADPSENKFRQHLVELERCTNAVPIDPQIFPIKEESGPNSYTLPLSVEQQLADDLAFLAAIEEGAQSVAAVCLEEHAEGVVVRFAALDLALSGEVKNALECIIGIMSSSANNYEDPKSNEALFELIVKLHFRRLLARLRSDKWEKPKYLSKQHKKPLWRDFANVIHRVQFLYTKREAAARRYVEGQLQGLAVVYEALESSGTDSFTEFDCLKELIQASYQICQDKEVKEFARRLEVSPSTTPTAKVASAIKCLRQIEKIASYKRIATSLQAVGKTYPSLFRNKIRLVFLTPYESVPTAIGYEAWATTCHVHAEVQLAVYYDLQNQPGYMTDANNSSSDATFRRPRVIGTSKWLCYLCYLFLCCHGGFVPANTHGRLYDQWTVPDLRDYQSNLRTRYREIVRAMDEKILKETRETVSAGADEPGFLRVVSPKIISRTGLITVYWIRDTAATCLSISKHAMEVTTSYTTPRHVALLTRQTRRFQRFSSRTPLSAGTMPTIVVVGATRGLGASLVKLYASDPSNDVFATARSSQPPASSERVTYISDIDIATLEAGSKIAKFLDTKDVLTIDTLIVTAGYFATESLEEPSFEAQERMYRICAIGPTILTTTLANASQKLLSKGSKVIFVSSESGSITLRHEKEGGGNYGHHASKAALNMSAKLLSLDLKDRGVAVAVVHPGFMRTEMTKGVGFDKFWDEGGAVTPDEAAESLVKWVDTFDISKTGEYWAPRGPRDIGTADPVLGPKDKLPTPLQLPW